MKSQEESNGEESATDKTSSTHWKKNHDSKVFGMYFYISAE